MIETIEDGSIKIIRKDKFALSFGARMSMRQWAMKIILG